MCDVKIHVPDDRAGEISCNYDADSIQELLRAAASLAGAAREELRGEQLPEEQIDKLLGRAAAFDERP